jgi:RNA polymerase sigma-70 factor (ECF subfamily)
VIRSRNHIVPTRKPSRKPGYIRMKTVISSAEARDRVSFLIARAAQGEDAAFSELYSLTYRKMRNTARAVCAHGADVEDILQDSFVKVWRNAHHFDPDRASPISWMSVIVRHTAIDANRRKTVPTTDLDHALHIAEPASDAFGDFDCDYARPIVATIMSQLPANRRRLLSLAYIEGESRQSLSKQFGVPVGTIKTWLRRTLEMLRTDCTTFVKH